ncbi:hypothetical protein FGO68_gene6992 [Halteria grandinella]|uniref:Uncharacterized protein n=1 Tax=Halteria grandinella TaxID=5974 RepID=A0A8J8SW68_HALGN|nr:hypothetical protein FGO68_gene6992 [Halteria grandinella]
MIQRRFLIHLFYNNYNILHTQSGIFASTCLSFLFYNQFNSSSFASLPPVRLCSMLLASSARYSDSTLSPQTPSSSTKFISSAKTKLTTSLLREAIRSRRDSRRVRREKPEGLLFVLLQRTQSMEKKYSEVTVQVMNSIKQYYLRSIEVSRLCYSIVHISPVMMIHVKLCAMVTMCRSSMFSYLICALTSCQKYYPLLAFSLYSLNSAQLNTRVMKYPIDSSRSVILRHLVTPFSYSICLYSSWLSLPRLQSASISSEVSASSLNSLRQSRKWRSNFSPGERSSGLRARRDEWGSQY